MNIVATCSFVCTAAYIYKKDHTRKGAVIGLVCGTLANILVMLLWNYVMTPIYFGMPREAVVPLLPWIALFNLLKTGLNSVIVFLIYKPVAKALRFMVSDEKETEKQKKESKMLFGGFAIICVIVLCLSFMHVI